MCCCSNDPLASNTCMRNALLARPGCGRRTHRWPPTCPSPRRAPSSSRPFGPPSLMLSARGSRLHSKASPTSSSSSRPMPSAVGAVGAIGAIGAGGAVGAPVACAGGATAGTAVALGRHEGSSTGNKVAAATNSRSPRRHAGSSAGGEAATATNSRTSKSVVASLLRARASSKGGSGFCRRIRPVARVDTWACSCASNVAARPMDAKHVSANGIK